MPSYLILICENESAYADVTPEVWEQTGREHYAFAEEAKALGGKILAGEALQPTATATTIRKTRTDSPVAVDGPFAETVESIGGFYLIEAPDDAVARAVAERCPAPAGCIELRPVLDTSGM